MKINKSHFRVSIFGSARTKRNDKNYKLVYNLAKLIAENDLDLITGGGPGLMDAASKGHHKGRKNNNLHSIGLTIKLPHEQKDGYHLDIKKDFNKFSGRLDKFMQLSNVVVVAPGGIGTILELFYTWQLVQVKQICNIPIILLGSMWEPLITWIKQQPLKRKLISKEDLNSIFIAKTPKQAMEIILKAKKHKTCLNIKRYT